MRLMMRTIHLAFSAAKGGNDVRCAEEVVLDIDIVRVICYIDFACAR